MTRNNKYKEEKTLLRAAIKHFDYLADTGLYSFKDGAVVSEFINNIVEWYRFLKEKDAGMEIGAYGEKILRDYGKINTKYGFNFTIESIQNDTIYEKELLWQET